MGEHGTRDPFDYQELRMALAMSGGVSLFIWMGGVALEIYRVVRADPLLDPPGADRRAFCGGLRGLLDLTRSTPRVDIVSGASAGGLNGGLLTMAMVHRSVKGPFIGIRPLSPCFRPAPTPRVGGGPQKG